MLALTSRVLETDFYIFCEMLFVGGNSITCPSNNGGAGTFYDAVPRRLIVDNHNMSTDSDTLLMEFPNQPLWTNIYVRNHAKASVPLLWSRVQVCQVYLVPFLCTFGIHLFVD